MYMNDSETSMVSDVIGALVAIVIAGFLLFFFITNDSSNKEITESNYQRLINSFVKVPTEFEQSFKDSIKTYYKDKKIFRWEEIEINRLMESYTIEGTKNKLESYIGDN